MIHIEEIYEKASEEKEEGNMYQGWYGFNHPGEPHFFDAMGEECANPGSVMWTVPWPLSDPEVSTGPLLYHVASKAQVRLITKLKIQSEFTQITYVGGENGGGVTGVTGMDGRDTLESARS
jgi:hypothetical protein